MTKKILTLTTTTLLLAFTTYLLWPEPGQCIQGNCENGNGTLKFRDGTAYTGHFKDGENHGFGIFTSSKGNAQHKYEGDWRHGKRHGTGSYTYPDKSRYIGDFRQNKKSGHGSFTWPDGTRLVGYWQKGEPEGWCNLYFKGLKIPLRGRYEQGIVKEGSGLYIYDDGSRYSGEWKDGRRHGMGLLLDEHGGVMKSGRWENGELVQKIAVSGVKIKAK